MSTNLQHLQVSQTLLDQFLNLPILRLMLMLVERIPRPSSSVLSEVVVRKLRRLSEQRAELYGAKHCS